MPQRSLLALLECLESTLPVHVNDTLASHRNYITLLEGLLSELLEYKHTKEEIREDPYVRRLYRTLAFCLGRAYMNCYEFNVEPCTNYRELIEAGVNAEILNF